MSKTAGVIGIGDMGSGLAKNLIAHGYTVTGHDLKPERMQAFVDMGGQAANNAAEVGAQADAVYVMVMNGDQCRDVILGDGLVSTMKPGSTVLLSATVKPDDARHLASELALSGKGIALIDTPVSGGFPGAQGGTLTLMAAGDNAVLDRCQEVMEAVSGTIHRVGEEAGMGQTVKACLQSLIGSIFSATFEASVLAAKAGVNGDVLNRVISTSSAGCVVASTSLDNIIDRKFEKTGSHISTMYKDLTIVMDVARELGVPLFTASTAMQLFQAGITRYPEGDNWTVARISEEIVDARLHRD